MIVPDWTPCNFWLWAGIFFENSHGILTWPVGIWPWKSWSYKWEMISIEAWSTGSKHGIWIGAMKADDLTWFHYGKLGFDHGKLGFNHVGFNYEKYVGSKKWRIQLWQYDWTVQEMWFNPALECSMDWFQGGLGDLNDVLRVLWNFRWICIQERGKGLRAPTLSPGQTQGPRTATSLKPSRRHSASRAASY